MAAEALYGFVGVLLGSATTAVLTIYHERLVSRREREARSHQREQDRQDQQWETPTAVGWEDANLLLQVSRARVFDDAIREVSRNIRDTARKCIYAESLDETKGVNAELRQLYERLNEMVANAIPAFY